MAEIPLVAEPRAEQGSSASRRLRHAGRVPGVLYGHGTTPVPLSVDARQLRVALSSEAGANALFDLEIGGATHLAIARELQHHPVRRSVSHVDFQVVRRDEVVPADVPVALTGEALAVTRAGGTLEHLLVTLALRAKPADIPTSVEVDISGLSIGDTLRLGDMALPAGVECDADPETVVVVALAPRVTEAAGEAGAEAQGGEAAGGGPAAATEG